MTLVEIALVLSQPTDDGVIAKASPAFEVRRRGPFECRIDCSAGLDVGVRAIPLRVGLADVALASAGVTNGLHSSDRKDRKAKPLSPQTTPLGVLGCSLFPGEESGMLGS